MTELTKIVNPPTKLLVDTPNLSVMLPGTCNAKCEFCFWNRDQEANKYPMMEFADRLANTLDSLPNQFAQVSVTGGEPTISPVFDEVMDVLRQRKDRYSKVVLTTNAVRLMKKNPVMRGVVDHINISRHHYYDEQNFAIFKTKGVPNTPELLRIVDEDYGADICFNCVVPPIVSSGFCEEYIDWSKEFAKIAAVNFRVYHDSMDECYAQKQFENKYGSTDVSTCPVCRVVRMKVRGMQVNWKYSVQEPTQHWDGIYECVVQPDGRLTADWKGNLEVKPEEIKEVFMAKSNRELAEELIALARRLLDDDEPKKETRTSKRVGVRKSISTSSGGSCYSPHGGGCR